MYGKGTVVRAGAYGTLAGLIIGAVADGFRVDPISEAQIYSPKEGIEEIMEIDVRGGKDAVLVRDPADSTRFINLDDFLGGILPIDRDVKRTQIERVVKLHE